jgi:hypothetical protein
MCKSRLFAIWPYDQFPYHLGGEIDRFFEEGEYPGVGYVKVLNYGGGCFKPKFVLPYEEGKKLLAKLEDLGVEYRAKKEELYEVYMKKLRDLLP